MVDARVTSLRQLRTDRQSIVAGHFLNVVGCALSWHPFKEVEVVDGPRLHPGRRAVFVRCEFRLVETCSTTDSLGVTDDCQRCGVWRVVPVTADEGRVLAACEHVINELASLALSHPLKALLGLQVRRENVEGDLGPLALQLH